MKSFFFYVHKELGGIENIWKIGKGMTPYSVVRARQKFLWNKFCLDYLYFGNPKHIDRLEDKVKQLLYFNSAKYIKGGSCQTEIFQIDINNLLATIDEQIEINKWQIKRLDLDKPYSASNSGLCPLKIPGESISHEYLCNLAEETFGKDPDHANFYFFLKSYDL